MKKPLFYVMLMATSTIAFSQSYQFKSLIDLETTEVISQGNTGTCWSFSTSSFLESEIMRLSGKHIDLSEMYNVRQTYPKKAWNYVMRQGMAQFSEGGLAHDVINSISQFGVVPNEVYTGLQETEKPHDHSEIVGDLKPVLDAYIKNPTTYKGDWKMDVEAILDAALGKQIETFVYEGETYTPQSFLEMTGVQFQDYVSITSFTHHPYNSNFILEIPDNFSNGSYYNVALDELVQITNEALKAGFSIELDCDVTETTFSSKYGLAVIPEDKNIGEAALKAITNEKEITPEFRQQEFENFNTTDDHLMHIVGMVEDQNGTIYYKVKNSWGKHTKKVPNDGFIYMSEAYFKLKTISIMVHKDALQPSVKNNLNL
ncbi:C1 family peptidase [Mangrovimonas sp. DI 80]|uniref:C1 family peptidase n=1 Tax=Mangrovimonas sp. DI 80 TaxID=1779330 RepID=UPI0009786D77|nr:C1 family peptidase [Mangrovimonas sp. DI 80]OMP32862.1 aminopeptidase [Mangrovimonas sp. DI 80]